MERKNFKIIAAQSNIDWTGRKITGAHNGIIAIKKGTLVLNRVNHRWQFVTTPLRSKFWMLPIRYQRTACRAFSFRRFFASERYPGCSLSLGKAKRK
jgi:hypothetical protein